jgi:antitoxin HicB
MQINEKHVGSSFDDFLKEDGIFDDVVQLAAKKRLALQFERQMKKKKITKSQMARKLHTSRAQVDRILSPNNAAVSIETIERAAIVLGCRLTMALQPIA